jgi:hypothetical protein
MGDRLLIGEDLIGEGSLGEPDENIDYIIAPASESPIPELEYDNIIAFNPALFTVGDLYTITVKSKGYEDVEFEIRMPSFPESPDLG